MLGTAGFIALWMVAATPAGAMFDIDDQNTMVRRAMLHNEISVRDAQHLAGGGASNPQAKKWPDSSAYIMASDDPRSNEEGIPGLPPTQAAPQPVERTPVPPPVEQKPVEISPETLQPSSPPIVERRDFMDVERDYGEAVCSDQWSCVPNGRGCGSQSGSVFRSWLDGVWWEGWLDQGVTFNSLSPRNRTNGPVTFNDRSNDYQLNQLYMRLARDVDVDGGAWDVGGRVDFLYGTDQVYVAARGLEVRDDLSPRWNAQRYGLAMPQCYMEVFSPWGSGLSVKMGHFYSILGYESVEAPANFFYSHSYLRQYAEPFTHTGLLAQTRLGAFEVIAGMTRGDDNWEDNNNDLGFTGGVKWANHRSRTNIAFCVDAAREQSDPSTNIRTVYSLVIQQKLGQNWECVLQHDLGSEPGAGIDRNSADWYGLNTYLFYTINDCWKAGMRFEWFRDEGGARVPGANQTADYFQLCPGVNWTPNDRLIVRSELRWDWTGTPGYYPFGDGTRSDQLLFSFDAIVRF